MSNALVTLLTVSDAVRAESRTIVTDTMVRNDIAILVSYEPHWLGLPGEPLGEFDYAYLELRILEPKGAPLPVTDTDTDTDTGYWSEFLSLGEAEEVGGPKAVVAAILDEMSNTKSWRVRWAKWEQRDLFA